MAMNNAGRKRTFINRGRGRPKKRLAAAPKRRPPGPQQGDWPQRFLAALAQHGNVSAASAAAGVSRQLVYTKRFTDPAFAERWEYSRVTAADVLEAEAWRRAVEGVEKQTTVAGKRVYVRQYSDRLLMFLLKNVRPEKYRNRQPRYRLIADEVKTWTLGMWQLYNEGMSIHYIRMMGKLLKAKQQKAGGPSGSTTQLPPGQGTPPTDS